MVRWRHRSPGLKDVGGVLCLRKRPEAAIKAAEASRDAIQDLWMGYGWPWFQWLIVDSRDGTIIKIID